MAKEQNFPRGGYSTKENDSRSPLKKRAPKEIQAKKLFGEDSDKLQKRPKSRKINTSSDFEPFSMKVSDNIIPDSVDSLSYKKIQDGMLLLGSVNYITSMNGIQVQLPGRCYGHISVHDISYEYTKHLTNALQAEEDGDVLSSCKQFQPGEFLPVKVLKKISEGNGFRIPLSINPNDVNSNITFEKLSVGMLLWVSVIERSDHCYNLNGGIANCRVVLPFAKTKIEYSNGENIWCAIQQVNIQQHASILTVSTLEEDIQRPLKKNLSLDILVPGMMVTFQVQKILKDGLRGTICQNCTAFIETINLNKITDNPKQYKVGQKLTATVLYVQPTTKFCYLTLQAIFNTASPCISIGTNLKGKVLDRKDKGIFLSLSSNFRGFIPYNRLQLLKESKKKSDNSVKTSQRLIAENYPNNTSISVRVIDYNYMERTYICTNYYAILSEKYFSIADLKIGNIVEGNIKEIKPNGIVITVGRIQGFISNMHLCDVKFTEAMKSKFKIKKKITAKVLSIKPNNVFFTLKRSLITNNVHLSSIDEIDASITYPGVVIKSAKNNFHVKFYGDLIGRLNYSDFKDRQDVTDLFYIGQVITTRITKIEDDVAILILSNDANLSENTNINESGELKTNKKKKRASSESITNNENNKKAKIQNVNEPENNGSDILESVEEKLQPIVMKNENIENVKQKRKRIKNDKEDLDLEETFHKKGKSKLSTEKPPIKDVEKSKKASKNKKPLEIRGMSDFFSTSVAIESGSESDDAIPVEKKKKAKKSSAKQMAMERREKERQEEERIRIVETQLADSSSLPQSAEQFDRALLGQPNSSKMWAQYIAFHMQSIEIEKARSVARTALEKIDQTEGQERLNIWTVLLNLEHEYGTKDSYDDIFKEAVSCNNSLPIYLLSIENHVAKGEFTEVESKWRKLKREYKNNLQMWINVAKIYYEHKQFDEARRLKNDGLKSLTDKTMQIELIVKFAIFEFNYGNLSQGASLFETIVQSDPKRVNVWTTYVDQLIKKNEIELARRVLERAVGNKIPFKKMKTLFKKYHEFEKQYGDAEKRTAVEKLAKEYASKISTQ